MQAEGCTSCAIAGEQRQEDLVYQDDEVMAPCHFTLKRTATPWWLPGHTTKLFGT